MPQVDFYLLEESAHQAEQYFICRLVAQLYRNKQSVYIHVEDQQYAEQIDQLLWAFRADAFIPHEIIPQENSGAPSPICSPVVIGYQPSTAHQADVLINLAEDIPAFYARFARVAEIVPGNENKRALLRKHYRFYKDQHCELKTHKISAPAK
jgi:DNA polymerase-3 subunit chi